MKTKTLFLCNKKSKGYYLVVTDDAKAIDMKVLDLESQSILRGGETINPKYIKTARRKLRNIPEMFRWGCLHKLEKVVVAKNAIAAFLH